MGAAVPPAIDDHQVATPPKSNRLLFWAIVAACIVAAAGRIAGARGELWLDEVWSIRLVQEHAKTPADIFFKLHYDANNILNSLFIFFVGFNAEAWAYRCPGIIAGILTVLVAGWTYRRSELSIVAIAVVLTGCSYLLVHFSSEVRGYSLQLFFSVSAFALLYESEVSPSVWKDCLFAATCILGFLAHPLFLILFLSTQGWTWLSLLKGKLSRPLATLLFRTIVPLAFFGWLYFVNLQYLVFGGGKVSSYFEVVMQVLSLLLGGPFNGIGAYLVASVCLFLILAALFVVSRKSFERACFYSLAIIIVPAIVLVMGGRKDIYPRYFLTSALFTLLLWTDCLAVLIGRVAALKKWIPLMLVVYALANGYHILQLIELGRGHYLEVIATMERETRGEQISLAVDHPVRHFMMLDYYSERMKLIKPLRGAGLSEESLRTCEWLLAHDLNVDFDPPLTLEFAGQTFRLVQHFSFPGLSGWHLCLYHKET